MTFTIIQTTMMTMMILPIAEAQIVAAQTVAAPEMTPVETLRIVETVRTSDGRMKCCKRDGRNSLTMSHPRGYYMEYSEDNQEG